MILVEVSSIFHIDLYFVYLPIYYLRSQQLNSYVKFCKKVKDTIYPGTKGVVLQSSMCNIFFAALHSFMPQKCILSYDLWGFDNVSVLDFVAAA